MNRQIAKGLLEIGAVKLNVKDPFVWASGIKSPVYSDNRLTLTAPILRRQIEDGLASIVRTHYPEAELLVGTATAGIPHAAIVGHILDKPMGYVRMGAKDFKGKRIEGELKAGQKVVVVEDLISTAKSSLEVVEVLRGAGAEVLGMASIFTYGMKKGIENMALAEVKNVSLTTLDEVVEVAADEGYIVAEDKAKILAFRDNPTANNWM
jgi:orotate phosphoribosyltransferase